jgi:hypothetical protein
MFTQAEILQRGKKVPSFPYYMSRRGGKINLSVDWNEPSSSSKRDKKTQALRKFRQPTGKSTFSSIKKAYTISNSQLMSIERFLDKHKDIADLVLEAHAKIRDFFTSETLLLELISDINIEGGEELFVYIQTYLSVEEAVEKINDFDEQWFLDQLNRTKGLFNFNLRFL